LSDLGVDHPVVVISFTRNFTQYGS